MSNAIPFPFWVGEPPNRFLVHSQLQLRQAAELRGELESMESFERRKMNFTRPDLKGLSLSDKWKALFEDACALPLSATFEWRRLMGLLHMREDRVAGVRAVLLEGDWRTADLTKASKWMRAACRELGHYMEPAKKPSPKLEYSTEKTYIELEKLSLKGSWEPDPPMDSDGKRIPEFLGRIVPKSLCQPSTRWWYTGWHIDFTKLWILAGLDESVRCVLHERAKNITRRELLEEGYKTGGDDRRRKLQAAWKWIDRNGEKIKRAIAHAVDIEIAGAWLDGTYGASAGWPKPDDDD